MVRIITDSAADFEPSELENMRISCVPLYVFFGETEYRENINLTKNQFYELLTHEKTAPTTSQPSPDSFVELITEARETGDEALIITLSSGLSGTYQGALVAKELAEYSGCYIVDSRNGTGGERMLVEQAVKMRDMGMGAAEIAKKLEKLREHIVLYTCMDTLEYLHRGGRISDASYRIGSLAHIKPIMHVTKEGKPEIPTKVIGLRKGIDYICKQLCAVKPDPSYPIYIMFTANRENGEKLAEQIRRLGYDIPDFRIYPVGAAIGAHIGPNACGVVYVAE